MDIAALSDSELIVEYHKVVQRIADGDYVSTLMFAIEDEMEKRDLLILNTYTRHSVGMVPVE